MSATISDIEVKGVKVPLLFEESNSLPILNLQLIFKNSGFIEDGKNLGLASISSKMLNEGTLELGSSNFAQKLDEKAITLNSASGFETLTIELSSLKEQNSEALSLLNMLLKSPNLSEDSLEKVKTLQIGNLKRKENDFDYIASKGLNELLFKSTVLENPSSGTVESISNISLDDVKLFLKDALVLNNLIIVAGGDIKQDDLKNLLNPILNLFPEGKIKVKEKISFTSKIQEKFLEKESEQAYIYFGSNFNTNSTDEDNYKAKVASFIFGGGGFGSRLMEEVRVKRGLAYSAYANVNTNRLYSYFSGYLQTKNESSDEAIALVKELLKDFVKNGVTKDELEAAKKFLTGSEPLRTETLAQRLNRAFMLYFKDLKQDYPKHELEKIQNLSLEDLNNYIKSHNEIENLTFFVVRRK